jgi:phosphopantetheinyl transferase
VVYVWLADAAHTEAEAFLSSFLSVEERLLAERLPESAGKSYVLRRALVRDVLSRSVGTRPAELDLELAVGDRGKERLRNGPSFSATSSENMAMIAVVSSGAIGASFWTVTPFADWDTEVQHMFTERDRAHIGSLSPERREEALYRTWSRKEALFTALADDWTRIETYGEDAAATWTVIDLSLGPRRVGAVAVGQQPAGVQLFRWTPSVWNGD